MPLGPFTENIPFCYGTQRQSASWAEASFLNGKGWLACSGGLTLEFPDQPEPHLLWPSHSVLDAEEDEVQQSSPDLQATSNTDTGGIKRAEPIKI